MALKQSVPAFVRDILVLVLERKGVAGTVLGALLGSGGLHLYQSADIPHQVEPKTADMAKYGAVTPEMACIEHVRFSKEFNAYLKEKGKESDIRNPELVLTPEKCLKVLGPEGP